MSIIFVTLKKMYRQMFQMMKNFMELRRHWGGGALFPFWKNNNSVGNWNICCDFLLNLNILYCLNLKRHHVELKPTYKMALIAVFMEFKTMLEAKLQTCSMKSLCCLNASILILAMWEWGKIKIENRNYEFCSKQKMCVIWI